MHGPEGAPVRQRTGATRLAATDAATPSSRVARTAHRTRLRAPRVACVPAGGSGRRGRAAAWYTGAVLTPRLPGRGVGGARRR